MVPFRGGAVVFVSCCCTVRRVAVGILGRGRGGTVIVAVTTVPASRGSVHVAALASEASQVMAASRMPGRRIHRISS